MAGQGLGPGESGEEQADTAVQAADFDIDYGRGISRVGCVLDVAVQTGVVERSGSFLAFGHERLGQGDGAEQLPVDQAPWLLLGPLSPC